MAHTQRGTILNICIDKLEISVFGADNNEYYVRLCFLLVRFYILQSRYVAFWKRAPHLLIIQQRFKRLFNEGIAQSVKAQRTGT